MIERHYCGLYVTWQRDVNSGRPVLMDADPVEAYRILEAERLAIVYHRHDCPVRREREPSRGT